jgi:hypothetical protein
MAGLVPAIHVFGLVTKKTWMPAPSAGMTIQLISFRSKAALNCRKVIFPSWPRRGHPADLISFCFYAKSAPERFRLTRVTRIFQLSALSNLRLQPAGPGGAGAYPGSCYFPVMCLFFCYRRSDFAFVYKRLGSGDLLFSCCLQARQFGLRA